MLYYYIKTFGCQLNKSDSERLKTVLEDMNMSETVKAQEADLIILNTCSVRQTAEDRVFGLMKNYAQWKKKKPHLILGITGCMVGHDEQQKLRKKMPHVDLYFPIKDLKILPALIQQIQSLKKDFTFAPICNEAEKFPPLSRGERGVKGLKNTENNNLFKNVSDEYLDIIPTYQNSFEAFVPIMNGCNNFCSYCIVPYARGRERSRKGEDILEEIKVLKKKGYQQVTLLGQNVNSYKPTDQFISKKNPYKHPFAALLWEINEIGIPWVFFTAPHPKDMSDEVIDALALPCMVNYLHLPLQSGDNTILQKMNRNYTAEEYLKLVEKIKKKKPNIALGTDIIIGFPGESEEQFENTLKLYEKIKFDISYHAVYSNRPYTTACKMKDQVPQIIKRERWRRLQHLMETITEKKNKFYKNKIVDVIIKEKSKEGWIGESREMKKVTVPKSKEDMMGKRVEVKVKRTSTWMLYGEIV